MISESRVGMSRCDVRSSQRDDPTGLDGTSRSLAAPKSDEGRFVVLTTAANASVKPIHDRMPFIVRDGQHDWWLNDDNMKETILCIPDNTPLDWYPVSREMNNVRNESPDLIRTAPMDKFQKQPELF